MKNFIYLSVIILLVGCKNSYISNLKSPYYKMNLDFADSIKKYNSGKDNFKKSRLALFDSGGYYYQMNIYTTKVQVDLSKRPNHDFTYNTFTTYERDPNVFDIVQTMQFYFYSDGVVVQRQKVYKKNDLEQGKIDDCAIDYEKLDGLELKENMIKIGEYKLAEAGKVEMNLENLGKKKRRISISFQFSPDSLYKPDTLERKRDSLIGLIDSQKVVVDKEVSKYVKEINLREKDPKEKKKPEEKKPIETYITTMRANRDTTSPHYKIGIIKSVEYVYEFNTNGGNGLRIDPHQIFDWGKIDDSKPALFYFRLFKASKPQNLVENKSVTKARKFRRWLFKATMSPKLK